MAAPPNSANTPTPPGRRKRPALLPLLLVALALIAIFVIFNLTRSSPNYQEEQFPQDAPETTT